MRANPYIPGSGAEPAHLTSREALVYEAETYLQSAQERHPQRSVIYYGPHGVGKTALLQTIEKAAGNMGVLHTRIEVGTGEAFTTRLIGALNGFLHAVSLKAPAGSLTKKSFALIHSFTCAYDMEESLIDEGTEQDPALSTGIFADDLTEVFYRLGKWRFNPAIPSRFSLTRSGRSQKKNWAA